VAARARLGDVRATEDRITPKLAALHFYQLAIPVPKPPAGSSDAASAERGRAIFKGKSRCASCHVPPIFTEPGRNLHKPEEIGIDAFQADRAPDRAYRTTPLRALWDTAKIHKGGFYHDGRFATLPDVVAHYNGFMRLGLTSEETRDLVEYLKSL
jgi:cytochrome c peroxidase